jgi:hypothetical protein
LIAQWRIDPVWQANSLPADRPLIERSA